MFRYALLTVPMRKIAGPAAKLAVDPLNHHRDVLPGLPVFRQLTDLAAEPVYLLARGSWSQIGLARSAVVVPTQGVTQKVKRFLRQTAEPRLGLVHRQLQLGHHLPHHSHGFFSRATTADHESSGPGEFHPQALSDPDGRLSPHPALMIQSPVESRSARGPAGSDRVAPPDPASGLRWWSDASTVCISAAPI